MEILFRPGSSGLQHNLYIHQELPHIRTFLTPPVPCPFFSFATNAQILYAVASLFFYQEINQTLSVQFLSSGPTGMSEPATTTQPTKSTTDPLTSYTRSLYDYTLALWTESRRVAEEKARGQTAANTQPEAGKDSEKQKDESASTTASSSSPGQNQK